MLGRKDQELKRELVCQYIRENQEDLYRFAYAYIKNRDDALDILQESIVKAIEGAKNLKSIDSIKPWFFRIIVNEANMAFRRNKKIVYIDKFEECVDQQDYSDKVIEDVDKSVMLQQVLSLKEKYRVIIVLRYYEELKLGEIAQALGISENTVKSRLYKALKILKYGMKGGQ